MINLRVSVTIEPSHEHGYGSLQIQENLVLPNNLSFLEMAKVLGQFHELAEEIKKNRGALK